ncbi:MAG: methyltransferase domain-containing protein [Patescibacteria group bacterium]
MENNQKVCEICLKEIPQDFINLLCADCYNNQVKEIEMKKKEEEEAKLAITDLLPQIEAPVVPQEESKLPEAIPTTPLSDSYNVNGITDPNYTENPEMEDKDQVTANIAQFNSTGVLLWHATRMMYQFIYNHCITKSTSHPQYPKFIWKPTIVDVGCGSGVGSNILSQEADFVWGIDKNENSIKFAKEAFTRVKNGIYYNSQVSFDQIDIINDNREFMKMDIVVAIEVIEHINDYKTFLKKLTQFDTKNSNNPTEYFISTPNRNNKSIQKDKPFNPYHVREWLISEYYDILKECFTKVEFFSAAGEPIPENENRTSNHTPVIAKCSLPKL